MLALAGGSGHDSRTRCMFSGGLFESAFWKRWRGCFCGDVCGIQFNGMERNASAAMVRLDALHVACFGGWCAGRARLLDAPFAVGVCDAGG